MLQTASTWGVAPNWADAQLYECEDGWMEHWLLLMAVWETDHFYQLEEFEDVKIQSKGYWKLRKAKKETTAITPLGRQAH